MRLPCRLAALLCLLSVAPAFAFTGRVVGADGTPLAGAEVSVLGRSGSVVTDANGRFAWTPDPPLPFEILVVTPGGIFLKPQLVTALPTGEEPLVVTVEALVSERVTVSGAAPDIEATPAAATTSLPQAELQTRLPANLVQALENVPGVNQVSEGQAAVPAVRGLSSGRTLILIDGARVNSERRAGSSATFLDPDVLEGVEVARGPGTVAYGSDAFGGVIAATTRKVASGAPLAVRLSGTLGTGVPERRVGGDISKGTGSGSILVAAHARDVDDWESPSGPTLNSGYSDAGVLARVAQVVGQGFLSAGYQGDFGRDVERPRNNSATVRFFYPNEDSHRVTAEYDRPDVGPFDEIGLHAFYGHYAQVTDQNRFATATTARSVERADISAHDFQFRGYARRPLGQARWEMGVDVNGRGGLRALDIIEQYNLDGSLLRTTENVSIDSARRVDSALYTSLEAAVLPSREPGRRRARRCRGLEELRRLFRRSLGDQGRRLGVRGAHRRQLPRPDVHRAGGPRLSRSGAVGSLLPRPVGPRLHHRQPRPRVRDQPAVRRQRALHLASATGGGLRLPVPDRRSDRALSDDHRQLLLPQPRPGPPARRRGGGAGRPAVAAHARRRVPGRARPRARSAGRPRRHHHRDGFATGAATDRLPRLRPGPRRLVRRGRSPRPHRARWSMVTPSWT